MDVLLVDWEILPFLNRLENVKWVQLIWTGKFQAGIYRVEFTRIRFIQLLFDFMMNVIWKHQRYQNRKKVNSKDWL